MGTVASIAAIRLEDAGEDSLQRKWLFLAVSMSCSSATSGDPLKEVSLMFLQR